MLKGSNYNISRSFASEILNVSLRTLDRYAKKKTISSVRRGRQLFFSEEELLGYKANQLAREDLVQKREQLGRHERHDVGSFGSTQDLRQGMRPERGGDFVEVMEARRREQRVQSGEWREESVQKSEPVDIRRVQTGVDKEWVSGQSSGQQKKARIQDDPVLGELSRKIINSSPELVVFKELYSSAKAELKQLRDQLYLAHERIGQLETDVKGRAPLLEYKKQQEEVLQLTAKTEEQEEKIASYRRKVDMHLKEMDEIQFQMKIERISKFVYGVLLFLVSVTVPIGLALRLLG